MQVNPKAGVTFASGLRSMMRADPDVIMVGEIRDRETAQIAVEAALTGHLVLSTLHTNDAPTRDRAADRHGRRAVPGRQRGRLRRRPAPGAAALRLQCRKPVLSPARSLRANGFEVDVDGVDAYEPAGCARCGGTGYKGRVGLYEVMPVNHELRRLAVARAGSDEIAALAVRARAWSACARTAWGRSSQGLTSFAEVARVTA